jgi:uncharacterized protein (TIGR03084 family)
VTTPLIERLLTDLTAEHEELCAVLEGIADSDWCRSTPAEGWTVVDQVTHLAHFDGITRMCIEEPEKFVVLRDGLPDLQEYVDAIGDEHRDRPRPELLAWWRTEHRGLVAAARAADPALRVPWFGPSMSLASKLTARIMETWAHGQDVVDALGVLRPSTPRLQHVARIGVLTFPNSFRTRGLDVPAADVHVSLDPPDGGPAWVWGDPGATDRIQGSALDFCLVVTQRRHVADTDLSVVGPVATEWMSLAQAFAGPSGPGRRPGQFPKRR